MPGRSSLRLVTFGEISVGGNLLIMAQDGDDELVAGSSTSGTVTGNISVNLGPGSVKASLLNMVVATAGAGYASRAGPAMTRSSLPG